MAEHPKTEAATTARRMLQSAETPAEPTFLSPNVPIYDDGLPQSTEPTPSDLEFQQPQTLPETTDFLIPGSSSRNMKGLEFQREND